MHLVRTLTAIVFALFLSGCAVSRESALAFARRVSAAESACEELLLEARADARQWSLDPSNPLNATARKTQLRTMDSAINARLAALRVIDAYAQAIAAEVQGETSSVTDALPAALSDLRNAGLTHLAAKAAPYAGAVTQAIALIEDLLRQRRVREAVIRGEPLIRKLIELLKADAHDLIDLTEARAELRQHQLRQQARELADLIAADARAQRSLITSVTGATLSARLHRALASMTEYAPIQTAPASHSVMSSQPPNSLSVDKSKTSAPSRSQLRDRDWLIVESAASRVEALAEAHAHTAARAAAYRTAAEAYLAIQHQTDSAMRDMVRSLDHPDSQRAFDLATQTLALRQAIVELRRR